MEKASYFPMKNKICTKKSGHYPSTQPFISKYSWINMSLFTCLMKVSNLTRCPFAPSGPNISLLVVFGEAKSSNMT